MTSDVFKLIKSLTGMEKKFVMKYAFLYKKKGDNILLQLFRLMDAQNEYNEEEIKKKIKNIANRKQELWGKIMSVLQYRSTKIEMVNARRNLDFIHILASKQLFSQALGLIEEMKEWSTSNGQLYFYGLTLQYESGLAQYLYPQDYISRVPVISKQITQNAEDILLTCQVFEFYVRCSQQDRAGQFVRNNNVQSDAAALVRDAYYNLDTSRMSLRTLFMFLDTKSTIHYLLKEYEKCYEYADQARAAFLSKPLKSASDWNTYRTWLANIMQLHSNAKSYTRWKDDLNELEKVMNTHFTGDLLTQCKFHQYRFWYHYRFNKFKNARHVIAEAEDFYQKHKQKLTIDDRIYYCEDFAIAFFDIGDFDKAWRYCHETIQIGKKNMSDIYEFVIMFYLFILLEKREYDFLRSRLKQFSKFLADKDITAYAFEYLVFAFMKKNLGSIGSRKDRREHLKWLKEEINKLLEQGNVYTIEVMEMFDFVKWVDKKIEDRTYPETDKLISAV